MTGPTLTGLALVRDQLAEARRYTHSDPRAAGAWLERALSNLAFANQYLVRRHLDLARVVENLIIGQRCMVTAPDVTDAAITLALWELGDLSSRLRKAAEAEGRDRELMDGYGPKDGDTL